MICHRDVLGQPHQPGPRLNPDRVDPSPDTDYMEIHEQAEGHEASSHEYFIH